MATVQVNCILHTQSGIQRDFVQNSFVFQSVGSDPIDLGVDAMLSLQTFYTSIGPWLSPVLQRVNQVHELLVYDIAGELAAAGSGIGSPIDGVVFAIPAANTTVGLPGEVAVCLSYRAEIAGAPVEGPGGTTRPRSRRTGRVYLGPLCTQALAEAPPDATRPAPSMRNDFLAAGADLRDNADHFWCVWSRVDNQLRAVQEVWVDNAFDTQRRRGTAPTSRVTL